ncbi:DUF6035 family protein [Escherichia coli O162:H7]
MGRYDRSIKIAFDKTSGEILEADEVFDIKTDAFEIRKKYHEKNLALSCCECEQDLMVVRCISHRLGPSLLLLFASSLCRNRRPANNRYCPGATGRGPRPVALLSDDR